MTADAVMLSLISAEICGRAVSDDIKNVLSTEQLEELYEQSRKHDLAHIVGNALSKLGCLKDDEISGKFKQIAMHALYRYMRMNQAYQAICKTLEQAQIPFVPLKGSVLRAFYPEPWLRTSCDIDVLVQPHFLEQAVAVLVNELGYTKKEMSSHDISLFLGKSVHLELHYSTVEDGRIPQTEEVLSKLWSDVYPVEGRSSHLQMSDELFYFYHMAHMAKHIQIGGCGIRPFLDLWILNHRVEHDRSRREDLLAQGGLLNFARAAEDLSEVWFSGAAPTAQLQYFERFVLDGGAYGDLQNQVAVQQTKKGSKLKYALCKIFLPYDVLKFHYPILQKYKWLTPIYEVVRWCKLLFKGGVKRSLRELQTNAGVSAEERTLVADMLEYLGL